MLRTKSVDFFGFRVRVSRMLHVGFAAYHSACSPSYIHNNQFVSQLPFFRWWDRTTWLIRSSKRRTPPQDVTWGTLFTSYTCTWSRKKQRSDTEAIKHITISMTDAIGSFPFGRPVRKVCQKDRTQKKVFVLGVNASAAHAQWVDKKDAPLTRM